MYFNEITEQKLIEYQQTKDERVFEKYLYIPFEKIVSSLLHKLKIYDIDGDLDVTIQDTIAFMWKKIDKFDPTKGFKGYSYFSLVARNFLINENKKSQKRLNNLVFIDEYSKNSSENDDVDLDVIVNLNKNISTYVENLEEKKYIDREDEVIQRFTELKEKVLNYSNSSKISEEKRLIANNIYKLMSNCDKFKKEVILNGRDLISQVSRTTIDMVKETVDEIKEYRDAK